MMESIEELRRLLAYDAETGVLTWREGLGLAPERADFEAWFLARYSYSRAVLTNTIWASEVKDAAEAFAAGMAAERQRWTAALRDRLDGSVMSKYASSAECSAAREALRSALLDGIGA